VALFTTGFGGLASLVTMTLMPGRVTAHLSPGLRRFGLSILTWPWTMLDPWTTRATGVSLRK